MTNPTCPGFAELEGICPNALVATGELCPRCQALAQERTPQQEREVRWPHGDMGEML